MGGLTTLITVLQQSLCLLLEMKENVCVCHSRINIPMTDGETMGAGPEKTPT